MLSSDRSTPVVVFADILGFADLVLELEPRISPIDYAYYSAATIEELHGEFGGRTEDPLTSMFICFHRLLEAHIETLMRADPLESVVFSDAAYIAFRDASVASHFAVELMRDLIRFGVPARMGISTGSFRAVRLATDVADGLRRHSSQFLGTGVVRAYRAESCGLKGMRIFIHPDAKLVADYPGELVSVGRSIGYGDRRTMVELELNYLHPQPQWIPQADGSPYASRYDELCAYVVDMSKYAGPAAQIHYEETLAALERMDSLYGMHR